MSILYLWLQDPRLDRFAAASAEVGDVFCARDAHHRPDLGQADLGHLVDLGRRLTLTLFLFFLLLGYQALRAAVHDPVERARLQRRACGIMGLVLVPFIHLSVYLFRALHPQPIVLKPSAPSLPPEMLRTLLVGFGVFTLLYIGLVTLRYGIQLVGEAREAADAA